MTHRLHGVFHDAQRRARSTSQELIGTVLDDLVCEIARLSSFNHPSILTARIFTLLGLSIFSIKAAEIIKFTSDRLVGTIDALDEC